LSGSGLPRDAPSQLCNIAHPTNVLGSNSCLNKRAYQKLKEAGYRKLKDATYQKIKEVDYRRLKESAYQMVGPKRRFGVRLCCNAARECSTMAARCTTGPFH
jgi:hypothetical protein